MKIWWYVAFDVQDAAGDFVRRAARRREDARIKSWAGKVSALGIATQLNAAYAMHMLCKSTESTQLVATCICSILVYWMQDLDKSRILNLARVLLHRLEDEEVVKMHTELCKLPSKQSSAKDTLTTQAATCQVVSEQTEQATTGIAHADASSLSTLQIAREELSDKLLLAAQTPRVFLFHFPLAKLKTYLYDSGVPKDFKPTSRHAWIEVVVKAWHKEYEDLQVCGSREQSIHCLFAVLTLLMSIISANLVALLSSTCGQCCAGCCTGCASRGNAARG